MTSITTHRQIFVALALVLMTAQRLPAPIQEIPESPTPTAEQPKRKKTESKPKVIEAKAKPSPSIAPLPLGPARFAGTWTGTINQGVLGDIAVSLTIDANGTSVKEVNRTGTYNHAATIAANTMTWKAGWLSEITWTFAPSADGKTAAVTSKSGFGVNGSATFRRQ
jgi:hypothetical protein